MGFQRLSSEPNSGSCACVRFLNDSYGSASVGADVMAFWTKKPDGEGETKTAEASKPPVEIFSAQSKQEIRSLFDRKTESVVDVEAVLDRYGKIRSALGSGTTIQGKLTFDTPVRIDGRLSGEIFSTAALIVGQTGVVDATVEVSSLIILGSVKGSVKTTERVEVYAGGVLEGSVISPVMVLEKGCAFNGECRMPQKERRLPESPIREERPDVSKPRIASNSEVPKGNGRSSKSP